VPVTVKDKEDEERAEALREMQERWAETEFMVVEPWTREELYERD
jgi:hypothetical protein